MDEKIHILDATTYETESDGIVSRESVTSIPPHEAPEGQIWHSVLGKFVPADWLHKEMWVDAKEVFRDEED